MPHGRPPLGQGTYAVVGRCQRTGMLGVALTTSSIAVGSRCPWVAPHAGAVSTQMVTDPRLGQLGLDLLQRGYTAEAVISELRSAGAYQEYRQLACVDRDGHAAAWTGERGLGVHGHFTGPNVAVAGNLLADLGVLRAMVTAFDRDNGRHLADRLMDSLRAGKAAGGEAGGRERSAALKVYHMLPFPIVDLRVDWDEANPVDELAALWRRYRLELDTFVTRALRPPDAAP
jgi:uncharacterized Ntn-hydrolase superfamily protein